MTADDKKFGLACKRPRSVAGMRELIKEGADQVARAEVPGALIIGLEAMLHLSGDPQKPTVLYVVDTPDELARYVNPRIDEGLVQAEKEIQLAFRKGVWGILFCGLVTGVAQQIKDGLGGPIYEWFRRPRSNPQFLNSTEFLDALIFGTLRSSDLK